MPFDVQIELLGTQAFQTLLTGLTNECCAAFRSTMGAVASIGFNNSSFMGNLITPVLRHNLTHQIV